MKNVQYILLMLVILAVEVGVSYGLFHFVQSSRLLYILFSLAVLIAIISYFSISGFLNKIKIVPQEELTRMIFRNTGSILGAAGIILILIIAVRALTLMVF